MKKSIIFFGGLLFLAAQSCDVLDKEPLDSISTEQYFSTANEQALETYCNDLYPKLISGHGNPHEYNYGMMETDFQSDDLMPWDNNSVAFSQNTISTSDDQWKWENIRACNAFLENYELSPTSEEVKQRYAGEILFFKCMDYFNKVRRFGDVPWYDHVLVPGDEDLYRARDSRTVVMANVLKDINQAIAWLPTKATTGVNRISKDAALALKARMCLFEGTFRRYHNIEGDAEFLQAAYDAAGELMKAEYGYSLFQGSAPGKAYHELFIQADYNSNPEIILSKEYDPAAGKGNNLTRQIGVGENPIGLSRDAVEDYLCAITGKPISICNCEGHTHHTTLIAELNNRDPRLLQTVCTPEAGNYTYYLNGRRPDIGKYTSGSVSSSTGYAVAKFYSAADFTTDHHQGTQDAPIFRYAEVLLVRAEAGAELGLDPELDKTVNALRERVGFTHHLTSNPTEDPVLVAKYPTIKGPNANLIREIRRERRVEMMAEGLRYYDLMRWACGLRLNAPKLGIIPDKATSENDPTAYNEADYIEIATNLGFAANGAIDVYTKRMTNPVPNFIEPKNYLFSIPTDEIGLNPNLEQNTGWK
ncbi:MAG: RagB/SusD family nutrient uptake outer membrane protein [Parabacteroides sp.]|nr:RagB/SusD family nutrient uptake outer membrane protein [Parabacteroides sp.]